MKKYLFSLMALSVATAASIAQPAPKAQPKEEKKEIIIEKNENDNDGKKEITINKKVDGKTEKMTIVVDGDNITINGKPMGDLKGKMKMLGDMNMNFKDLDFGDNMSFGPKMKIFQDKVFNFHNNGGGNKALLGVVTEKNEKGAKISDITKESGADKAGLQNGDVITKVNDDAIAGPDELVKSIGKMKPADMVDVTVLRNGKEKKFKATLGKNKDEGINNMKLNFDHNFEMPEMPEMQEGQGGAMAPRRFNFDFNQNFDGAEKPKYGFSIKDNENGEGAVITKITDGSNAAKAGLLANDIVTEANGNVVKTTDDLKTELKNTTGKTAISMKVLRNGKTEIISVNVPKKIKTADL